jgi:hypothetical protein
MVSIVTQIISETARGGVTSLRMKLLHTETERRSALHRIRFQDRNNTFKFRFAERVVRIASSFIRTSRLDA